MSPEPRPSSRANVLRATAGAAVLAILLSACGWTPLYAPTPYGLQTSAELGQITIPAPRNRLEQRIRNNLISMMSPGGLPAYPAYRLEILPIVTTNQVLIQRDTDARRIQYRLNVRYRLFDVARDELLTKGTSFSVVSYNRVVSEFANVRAKLNAQEKTTRAVSEDIRTRLASYFASS